MPDSLLRAPRPTHQSIVTPLKVGVIGCGHVARTIYGPIIAKLDGLLQVTAICDLDQRVAIDLLERYAPHARIYTETHTLLDNEELDAVLVLTSESASAAVALQVLNHGLPVYLEKPPATSLASLESLMSAEKANEHCIYTAFNRRHTPLFQPLKPLQGKVKQLTGVIERRNRTVETFPFTSVHLLDSAQYFGGSPFAHVDVHFERNGVSSWHLRGTLESGAICDLTFVPDGTCQDEYLTLESDAEIWRLQFPDPAEAQPDVRLIRQRVDGPQQEERVDTGLDPLEKSGYAPCLRHFIELLRGGKLKNSVHRLSSCVRTIAALEAMQKANSAV